MWSLGLVAQLHGTLSLGASPCRGAKRYTPAMNCTLPRGWLLFWVKIITESQNKSRNLKIKSRNLFLNHTFSTENHKKSRKITLFWWKISFFSCFWPKNGHFQGISGYFEWFPVHIGPIPVHMCEFLCIWAWLQCIWVVRSGPCRHSMQVTFPGPWGGFWSRKITESGL